MKEIRGKKHDMRWLEERERESEKKKKRDKESKRKRCVEEMKINAQVERPQIRIEYFETSKDEKDK